MIGMIIFFSIAITIAIVGLVIAFKEDNNSQGVLITLGLVVAITILSIVTYHEGYKQATIDLQTGHIPLYELITNPDSTKEWKPKR